MGRRRQTCGGTENRDRPCRDHTIPCTCRCISIEAQAPGFLKGGVNSPWCGPRPPGKSPRSAGLGARGDVGKDCGGQWSCCSSSQTSQRAPRGKGPCLGCGRPQGLAPASAGLAFSCSHATAPLRDPLTVAVRSTGFTHDSGLSGLSGAVGHGEGCLVEGRSRTCGWFWCAEVGGHHVSAKTQDPHH